MPNSFVFCMGYFPFSMLRKHNVPFKSILSMAADTSAIWPALSDALLRNKRIIQLLIHCSMDTFQCRSIECRIGKLVKYSIVVPPVHLVQNCMSHSVTYSSCFQFPLIAAYTSWPFCVASN